MEFRQRRRSLFELASLALLLSSLSPLPSFSLFPSFTLLFAFSLLRSPPEKERKGKEKEMGKVLLCRVCVCVICATSWAEMKEMLRNAQFVVVVATSQKIQFCLSFFLLFSSFPCSPFFSFFTGVKSRCSHFLSRGAMQPRTYMVGRERERKRDRKTNRKLSHCFFFFLFLLLSSAEKMYVRNKEEKNKKEGRKEASAVTSRF